jgi:hypothetical protein
VGRKDFYKKDELRTYDIWTDDDIYIYKCRC